MIITSTMLVAYERPVPHNGATLLVELANVSQQSDDHKRCLERLTRRVEIVDGLNVAVHLVHCSRVSALEQSDSQVNK